MALWTSAGDRKTIGQDIALLEYGWPIGMPTCRPLGAGLFEVRSDISYGIRVINCATPARNRHSDQREESPREALDSEAGAYRTEGAAALRFARDAAAGILRASPLRMTGLSTR